MTDLIAACGHCEGHIFMLTCDHANGTGHEWVLVSVCVGCRTVHWIDEGCHDCHAALAAISDQKGDEW